MKINGYPIRKVATLEIKSFEMWREVAIKNKTVRTLKNGVVIPTALSMERRIAKLA